MIMYRAVAVCDRCGAEEIQSNSVAKPVDYFRDRDWAIGQTTAICSTCVAEAHLTDQAQQD